MSGTLASNCHACIELGGLASEDPKTGQTAAKSIEAATNLGINKARVSMSIVVQPQNWLVCVTGDVHRGQISAPAQTLLAKRPHAAGKTGTAWAKYWGKKIWSVRFVLRHALMNAAKQLPKENRLNPNRLAFLDGWRGLAIIVVLFSHFSGVKVLDLGAFGVDLFFVLSGRLMASILFVDKVPLAKFFVRRISRIYPVLLVFSILMYLASLVLSARGYTFDAIVQPFEFMACLLFLTNYAIAIFGMSSVLDHTWSIAVEEHSYLILAMAALAARRDIRRGRLVVAVICIVILINSISFSFGLGPISNSVYWRSDVRAFSVLSSCLVYLIRMGRSSTVPPKGVAVWVVFVFLLSPFFYISGVPKIYAHTVGVSLLALAVNYVEFSPKLVLEALSRKSIGMIGILSYSIYIWQQPFYRLQGKISNFILIPTAVMVGVASFFFIETPARKYINGLRLSWSRYSRV